MNMKIDLNSETMTSILESHHYWFLEWILKIFIAVRLTIGRGFQSWDACWAESWVPWYTLFLSKYTTFQEMMGRLVTNFSQSFQLIPSLQGLVLKKMVWVWETWPLLRMVCVNLLARDLRWAWLKRHLNCNYLMSCCCVFNVTASDSKKKKRNYFGFCNCVFLLCILALHSINEVDRAAACKEYIPVIFKMKSWHSMFRLSHASGNF